MVSEMDRTFRERQRGQEIQVKYINITGQDTTNYAATTTFQR